jgi:hypothetical protein
MLFKPYTINRITRILNLTNSIGVIRLTRKIRGEILHLIQFNLHINKKSSYSARTV